MTASSNAEFIGFVTSAYFAAPSPTRLQSLIAFIDRMGASMAAVTEWTRAMALREVADRIAAALVERDSAAQADADALRTRFPGPTAEMYAAEIARAYPAGFPPELN